MARDEREERERERERLAKAHIQEAEDLLAGFDRPVRTPEPPRAKPDFVEHYLKKSYRERPSQSQTSSPSSNPAPRRPQQPTVKIHRGGLKRWHMILLVITMAFAGIVAALIIVRTIVAK